MLISFIIWWPTKPPSWSPSWSLPAWREVPWQRAVLYHCMGEECLSAALDRWTQPIQFVSNRGRTIRTQKWKLTAQTIQALSLTAFAKPENEAWAKCGFLKSKKGHAANGSNWRSCFEEMCKILQIFFSRHNILPECTTRGNDLPKLRNEFKLDHYNQKARRHWVLIIF